ncbi:MAG: hypothetical protein CFE24_09340 [Flavobacterium sp. BFFFF2]|nr:MAG: hypothetical protein CFE24_09340 [Flavobacterium sp. BFFFF2]
MKDLCSFSLLAQRKRTCRGDSYGRPQSGSQKNVFVRCWLEQFVHCFNIAFHKKFRFENDYFLLKDLCSFSLLAQRKRTKRKGLFGPHKRSFLPSAKPLFQAEIFSKASKILPA